MHPLKLSQKNSNAVKEAVKNKIEKFTGKTVFFSGDLDCVHNYASLEGHYGEKVWVHRKGAVRVRKGEKAVIPGAMGSHSYVVERKGNPESFGTASHGAGRDYSRTAAMEKFSVEKVMADLKEQGIIMRWNSEKRYHFLPDDNSDLFIFNKIYPLKWTHSLS